MLRIGPVEILHQHRERRVQPVAGERELERTGHVVGGLAAGASVGHGQGVGDAVGREEEVAVVLAELPVQVEGEVIVARGQGGHVRVAGGRLLGAGETDEAASECRRGEDCACHGSNLL